MYVGYLGTQWDVTIQPVKTKPKLICQNKSYVRHKLVAYFPFYQECKEKLLLKSYPPDF